MKRILFQLLYSLGITSLFRHAHQNRLTIVLYHGVRPDQDLFSSDIRGKHIPEKIFREQMTYLKKNYHVLGWSDAMERIKKKKPFPKNSLCITFDDGYANHALAGQILHELALPAIFYVTTGFIDGQSLWTDRLEIALKKIGESHTDAKIRQHLKTLSIEPRESFIQALESKAHLSAQVLDPLLQPMSWNQIRTLVQQHHEIGGHTISHPILSRESSEACQQELAASKQMVETQTSVPCHHFAYPNGQATDFINETISLVQKSGYASAVTTIAGHIKPSDDPYTLKRISLDHCLDLPTFVVTVTGMRYWASKIKKYFLV